MNWIILALLFLSGTYISAFPASDDNYLLESLERKFLPSRFLLSKADRKVPGAEYPKMVNRDQSAATVIKVKEPFIRPLFKFSWPADFNMLMATETETTMTSTTTTTTNKPAWTDHDFG